MKILSKQRRKSTREKTLRKIAREAACLAAVQVQGAPHCVGPVSTPRR